jgi:Berberine and berberine like
MATARQFAAELKGFASGAYVNALSDEGVGGVRRAYPAGKLARLTAVKDRYDPDNVFYPNQTSRRVPWRQQRDRWRHETGLRRTTPNACTSTRTGSRSPAHRYGAETLVQPVEGRAQRLRDDLRRPPLRRPQITVADKLTMNTEQSSCCGTRPGRWMVIVSAPADFEVFARAESQCSCGVGDSAHRLSQAGS